MSDRYAAHTKVAVEKSRAEIEQLLDKYGATGFVYGRNRDRQIVGFEIGARRYRFTLRLPSPDDQQFTHQVANQYGALRERSAAAARAAYEQEQRRAWRELAMYIKAVLIAAASGIITLEEALLAYAVTPDNTTVAEWLLPQLEQAEQEGRMPPLLPG